MKLAVKKLDAVRWELKFEVPRDRVSKKFDKIYEELGKVVKVKGFRQGKVPRHILETQHSKLAKEEVIKELIPEVYQEGLEKEKIKPIDLPEILDVNINEGKVTFTAKLDVKPEVKVSDYKKIKVTRKSSTVTPEEVNKTLEFFKKAMERAKRSRSMTPSPTAWAFPVWRNLPNRFPANWKWTKTVTTGWMSRIRSRSIFLKKAKLTTPVSMVKKQLARRLEDIHRRLASQGLSPEEIKKKEEEIRPQLEESVERDIRIYLILDKIAEQESIPVKENENLAVKVMEFLLKEAEWEEAK